MDFPEDDDPLSLAPGASPSLPSCAEGLIAATLALMTGYAEHCAAPRDAAATGANAAQAAAMPSLLAAKAASNLAMLAGERAFSAPLRSTLLRLGRHWQALERRQPACGAAGSSCSGPREPNAAIVVAPCQVGKKTLH